MLRKLEQFEHSLREGYSSVRLKVNKSLPYISKIRLKCASTLCQVKSNIKTGCLKAKSFVNKLFRKDLPNAYSSAFMELKKLLRKKSFKWSSTFLIFSIWTFAVIIKLQGYTVGDIIGVSAFVYEDALYDDTGLLPRFDILDLLFNYDFEIKEIEVIDVADSIKFKGKYKEFVLEGKLEKYGKKEIVLKNGKSSSTKLFPDDYYADGQAIVIVGSESGDMPFTVIVDNNLAVLDLDNVRSNFVLDNCKNCDVRSVKKHLVTIKGKLSKPRSIWQVRKILIANKFFIRYYNFRFLFRPLWWAFMPPGIVS